MEEQKPVQTLNETENEMNRKKEGSPASQTTRLVSDGRLTISRDSWSDRLRRTGLRQVDSVR